MTVKHFEYTAKKADGTYDVDSKVYIDEYVGTTLCDREENYYDDSDGYAHVWSPENGIQKMLTWTTRFGDWHAGTTVDAYSDTTSATYGAMVTAHIDALGKMLAVSNKYANLSTLAEAFTPQKGDYVRVARGRKVPVGTEGVIIWTGERSYSQWQARYGKADLRVGVKDANGDVHWTDAKNVDLVDEPVYTLLPEDVTICTDLVREWSNGDLKRLHAAYCRGTSSLVYLG